MHAGVQVLGRVFLSHRSGGGSCKVTIISKMARIFKSTTCVQKEVIRILCASLAYKARVIRIHSNDHFDSLLEHVESKYECPICLLGLREPVQTICGRRFCSDCKIVVSARVSSVPPPPGTQLRKYTRQNTSIYARYARLYKNK